MFNCSRMILALACAAALVGCGGEAADKPVTAPVQGTVTLDGKPLVGATVTFLPTRPQQHGAVGTTDAEGKYTLFVGDNAGAQPGSYKVFIQHYTKRDGTPIEITPDTDMETIGDVKQSLPARYSDPERTELTVDVPEDGTENADFQLSSE